MPAVQTNLCNLDPHRLKTSSWQSRLLQTPTPFVPFPFPFPFPFRFDSSSTSDISFRPGVLAERAPQFTKYRHLKIRYYRQYMFYIISNFSTSNSTETFLPQYYCFLQTKGAGLG